MPKSMLVRLGWIGLSFGAIQLLRLINNVLLTRLLEPSIFGLMSLVIAIRVGIELVADIGITQNIVSNPRGDDPDFYDTAWTLQVVRGIFLAGCCFVLAGPFARFFGHAELVGILSVASLLFLFTGFDSTGRGLIQKKLNIRRMAMFDIAVTLVAVVAQVGLALISRTVWALVLGNIIASAATLIFSFLYVPGLRHRFFIDPERARQLLRFGKWVFMSTIVYFFAMNFDRLYFAKQITLSQLGVYGIARNLAEMASQLVVRGSNSVLYPMVAAAGLAPLELRQKLLRGRRTMLFAAALALGSFVALSDVIVGVLYDARYAEVGAILPILCVGVWFGILTSTNDSILMGLSKPAYPAISNAAKLMTYLIGMPLAFQFYGFTAAIAIIVLGEVVKYLALWALSHKEQLHFGRDDLVLTIAFAGSAVAMRLLLLTLGLTSAVHPIHFRTVMGSLGL